MNEHNFANSLQESHDAEDLPIWEEMYRQAFPTMIAMHNHRGDGQHQRNGIDRSVILDNGKQIWIDEKIRKVDYGDIILEYLSDSERNVPGWVCKPLLADYIAYAIAPTGIGYLLPVLQLQSVWREHGERWIAESEAKTNGRRVVPAENRFNGREWLTLSAPVKPIELFPLIGKCLRVNFAAYAFDEKSKTYSRISAVSQPPAKPTAKPVVRQATFYENIPIP